MDLEGRADGRRVKAGVVLVGARGAKQLQELVGMPRVRRANHSTDPSLMAKRTKPPVLKATGDFLGSGVSFGVEPAVYVGFRLFRIGVPNKNLSTLEAEAVKLLLVDERLEWCVHGALNSCCPNAVVTHAVFLFSIA